LPDSSITAHRVYLPLQAGNRASSTIRGISGISLICDSDKNAIPRFSRRQGLPAGLRQAMVKMQEIENQQTNKNHCPIPVVAGNRENT